MITDYPLTYAVFYRSVIEPYTCLHQYDVNNILLTGKLEDGEDNPNYINRIIGNGYVSGDKTVKNTLTKEVTLMPPECLVPRIKMLGLQDMTVILATIKKLISIVSISDSLRTELLERADKVDTELFMAEMLQLSLKTHNKALKLTSEHKAFLNTLNTYDISADVTPSEKHSEIKNFKGNALDFLLNDTKSFTGDDELDSLLNKYIQSPKNDTNIDGDYAYWKRLNLPEGFETLIAYVAPFVTTNALINLDWADIQSVCQLDMETKTCRNGRVDILEVSCPADDLSLFENALAPLQKCDSCLLNISCGNDAGMIEIESISDLVLCHMTGDALPIFGVVLSDDYNARYKIQILCHIPDADETEEQAPSTEPDYQESSYTISREEIADLIDLCMSNVEIEKPEPKREIQIPNCFRIKK